ncbi:VWA domain-containing protein [Luteitalea sp.]
MYARIAAACLLATLMPVSSAAQIMSGQRNQPSGNLPSLPLDTNVGTTRPTFRATVTRVEVTTLVVDAQGQPVRDLRAEDFEVFDGGRKQKVLSFAAWHHEAAAIPINTLPPADALAAATATNGWSTQSRVFALLLDDLHIDPRNAERARVAARAFIDRLAPSDLLFVGLTSDPVLSTGAFSRDRRRARQVIDAFGGMRLTDSALEVRRTPMWGRAPGMSDVLASDQQRSMRLAQAYGAVQRIATAARTITGRRKSMVFVSEGSPVGASSTASTALTAEATAAMRDAVAAATVAGLAIYPLSPIGLDIPTDRMIEGFTRQVDEQGRDVAHVDLANLVAEFLQAKNSLRDLATLTGGVSLIYHNDTAQAFALVLQDASDGYVLGYEPDKAVKGAKMRSLEVRVKRPGVRVRARSGYLAPPAIRSTAVADPAVSPALAELLGGVVAEDMLPMFVQAVPVAREGDLTRFALVVDIVGGPLLVGMEGAQLPLEQAVVSVGPNGKVGRITHRRTMLKVTPEAANSVAAQGLRTVWSINLPAGDHQVRIATVQTTSGARGSLYLDLLVTDEHPLDPKGLAGLLQEQKPTAFVDSDVQAALPAPYY